MQMLYVMIIISGMSNGTITTISPPMTKDACEAAKEWVVARTFRLVTSCQPTGIVSDMVGGGSAGRPR